MKHLNARRRSPLFFYFLAAVVLLVSCNKKDYSHLKDKPIPVEIEVVGQNTQQVQHSYIGEIEAKSSIPLVFPLGGELTSLCVRSGEYVHKGEVIATVDDTQARSMYESAESVLQQAEDGYKRLKPVYEQGGISEVKWVEMQTNLQKARSMFQSSEKRLNDCTLRAAGDGVVNLNSVTVGQRLAISQPIGELLDMSGKRATFMVAEREIGEMLPGTKITILMPALNKEFTATISEYSLKATHLAHTFKVTADIDKASGTDVLLPSMVCRAVVNDKKVAGCIISSSCVQIQTQGPSVWVLQGGKAHRQIIQIDDYVENGVLVSEGLHIGDTVIRRGYQKMYEGAIVEF